MSGHVFVVRGDIRRLACDAWLMPCGARHRASRHWLGALPFPITDLRVVPALAGARVWEIAAWFPGFPRPWLTDVGGGMDAEIDWFVDGALAFLERVALHHAATTPDNGRQKHLFALPLVGTGHGGAHHRAGEIVTSLMPALQAFVATHDVDVALVTDDDMKHAAAQASRRGLALHPAIDRAAARRLAEAAQRDQLTLFVGAGVGASAGLPMWGALLDDLARDAGMSPAEVESLGRLDVLDRARVVELRLQRGGDAGGSLGARVAARLGRVHGYGLVHGLLAALPVRQVVTTNYDQLFERASRAAGYDVSILPHGAVRGAARWLLKMHGCVSRPADIVLTRESYLRYDHQREALAAIVKALLLTSHMLFVGFSMTDHNFHRIVDAVRRARPEGDADVFGTAVHLFADEHAAALWGSDLARVDVHPATPASPSRDEIAEASRRVELLLDWLGAESATTAHLLAPRLEGALGDAERRLRDGLLPVIAELERLPGVRALPAWALLEEAFARLGRERQG